MNKEKSFLKTRLKSFLYAWRGLKTAFKEEINVRIHLLFAFLVLITGLLLRISLFEWIFIIFAIFGVIICELINTCIENICDFISPEKHMQIKKIKDIAASFVLFASIGALCIGVIIFLPKIIHLFH